MVEGAVGNKTLELQTNRLSKNFGRNTVDGNSANQNRVIEKNFDDKISKAVDNAVMTVEKQMHDAILTAMDNVVTLRVEMAARSITESSRRGPNSVVQNPGQRDFTGNTENAPLMPASSRLDLNIYQDGNDETCNVENHKDGDFPVLRPNNDRRAHAHHNGVSLIHRKRVSAMMGS